MSAARLLLLLLLVLVAVVIVLVVLRRGAARRDAQRVEAAGLRADADTLAATVAGQSVFADQAVERAELARVEAEDKAREAARLEEEAAQHRAAVEASRRDYEATMRRADDIDPDVKESAFAPTPDAGDVPAGDTDDAGAEAAHSGAVDPGARETDDETTMSRTARRETRETGQEEDTGSGYSAPSAASSAATAGAAGGAAAGAAAWAARSDDEPADESERIASAADFRDDVPAEPADSDVYATSDRGSNTGDVYVAPDSGNESDMSDDSRTETSEHAHDDDGLGAGGAAAAASAESGGAYAATRALHEEQGPAAGSAEDDADVAHDVESPRGEWGGPPDGGAAAHEDTQPTAGDDTRTGRDQDEPAADGTVAAGTDRVADRDDAADVDRSVEGHDSGGAGQVTVIEDVESYAATEPVRAEEQTPPVSPQETDTDTRSADEPGSMGRDERRDDVPAVEERDDHRAADERAATDQRQPDLGDAHAPAEAGASVAETDDTDRSASDLAEQPTQQRYDPTPARDWAADEGELLEETHDRGERLESERSELDERSDDGPGAASAASGETVGDTTGEQSRDRRISGFDELRDGGFGVGSAAPLDDGAQPLDHPVQANRDTMTYQVPGDAGYDSAEPHVWFYDEDAAQRSGFRRSGG